MDTKKMKDTKKSSRLRRQRGYSFEIGIVEKFKKFNWNSRRLGSPSTNLPDVMSVNNNTIIALEAKSTSTSTTYVPADQIERCVKWVNLFGLYKKTVLLAFKFKGNENRKLRYYYKVFPYSSVQAQKVRCSYNGKTFLIGESENVEIFLEDFSFE